MTTFRNAIRNENNFTQTENGMTAFKSSLNANVDLFFSAAASRGKDITAKFSAALSENRELALRLALWLRDAREGAGEREQFRSLLKFLENNDESALLHVVPVIPQVGRWDDLLIFTNPTWKAAAFSVIAEGLAEGNGLCAKWMPRKGQTAVELRDFLGLTPKQYRKGLVSLSNTVEQLMCAKRWNEIEFGKIPSLAAKNYQKAFNRNCAAMYQAYKLALTNGKAKVNASAIFPYDVLKGFDRVVAQAQWNALPNFLTEDAKILPMIDVSGSMQSSVSSGLTAMDVAVSLGLYIATKQTGSFGDVYLTFTDRPALATVDRSKNIVNLARWVRNNDVGYSTNIERAFAEILRVAKLNSVPQAEMPKYLLVFSDMQFDASAFGYRETVFDNVKRQFEAAGYELPKLVWWNIADRGNNIPVKYDTQGNALVSGFSPSLVKSILSAKTFTPEGVMLETLLQERYDLA
jgi:Domain of unknown function (DUF2828)